VARNRPIRDATLALTLLTCVPVRVTPPEDGEVSEAASWFPLIGLGLALPVVGVFLLALRVFYGVSGALTATVLVLLALATRLLHWDGLADVADAFFIERPRRLEVLSDTSVGAFGATAVALAALLEWSALTEAVGTPAGVAVVLVALVFARFAATCAAWFGKPARPGGLGASVMRRPSVLGVLIVALTLAATLALAGSLGLVGWALGLVGGLALIAALAVPHLISMRFGGVTGDVMGASVLLTETIVMLGGLVTLALLRMMGWVA